MMRNWFAFLMGRNFYLYNFGSSIVVIELGKLSPDIPLVAEEDSAFLRSRDTLVATVVNEVTSKASPSEKPLTQVDVLEAIDRGKKNAVEFRSKPATYWVGTLSS